jgi:hypothetical protein
MADTNSSILPGVAADPFVPQRARRTMRAAMAEQQRVASAANRL